jgi:hypothetical protein
MNTPEQVSKKTNIIVAILVVVILAMTAVFVISLLAGSKAKPAYTFNGSVMNISGQFGIDIDLSGASVTQETTLLPKPESKTNGAGIGNIYKGNFQLNGEKVYLNIIDKTVASYILITSNDGSKYYINCATLVETSALYQEILAHTTA